MQCITDIARLGAGDRSIRSGETQVGFEFRAQSQPHAVTDLVTNQEVVRSIVTIIVADTTDLWTHQLSFGCVTYFLLVLWTTF